MRLSKIATAALVISLSSSTHADVVAKSPAGFVSKHVLTISAPPSQVFRALTDDVGRWWNPEHSYSGVAANFSLDARAGGCFCERLKNGSVAHMSVVFVERDATLRMVGGLGPLQAMAVSGSMTFKLAATDGGGYAARVRVRRGRIFARWSRRHRGAGRSRAARTTAAPATFHRNRQPGCSYNAVADVAFASIRRHDSAAFCGVFVAALHFRTRIQTRRAFKERSLAGRFHLWSDGVRQADHRERSSTLTGFRLFPDHLAVDLVKGVFDPDMRRSPNSRVGLDEGAARGRSRQPLARIHVQAAGIDSQFVHLTRVRDHRTPRR